MHSLSFWPIATVSPVAPLVLVELLELTDSLVLTDPLELKDPLLLSKPLLVIKTLPSTAAVVVLVKLLMIVWGAVELVLKKPLLKNCP